MKVKSSINFIFKGIWKKCDKLADEYGEVVRIWVSSELGILFANPKDVEMILSSSKFIEKSETYRFLKPWLNDGLLVSTGKIDSLKIDFV